MSRAKRHIEEEHENHERWLVSYADMVTVLLALFIVMYAMGLVDIAKFNAFKAGMNGDGQSMNVLTGANSLLSEPGSAMAAPVSDSAGDEPLSNKEQQAVNAELRRRAVLGHERTLGQARAEVQRLKEIMKKIEGTLAARGLSDDVRMTLDERGLVLSLVSKHIIFDNDMPTLSERGRAIVDILAPVLAKLDEKISIDGHTNQVPVKPKYFETDWELSSMRAVGVLRYLNEQKGIPQARMVAAAYGPEKPLIDPKKPGSQEINKRVDIVVLTSLPAEARALMNEAIKAEQQRQQNTKTVGTSPTSPKSPAKAEAPRPSSGTLAAKPHAEGKQS